MKRVKEINVKDLSDETLKGILKFNPYDCDEVLIRINPEITMIDIEKRVLELNRIHHDIVELLCWQGDDFPPYSEKYNNSWVDIDLNSDGKIDSVTHNSKNVSNAIGILMESLINEDLAIGVEDYIDDVFNYQYSFIKRAGSNKYFNFNYTFRYEEYK